MAKKSLKEKIESDFQDWADMVKAMSISELDSTILRFAKYREEIEESFKNNPKLKEVRDLKSDLEAPFKENLKHNKMKTKYLIMLLNEKGGDSTGTAK